MRLVEIMSSPVARVSPGESVARAAQRMREENVHHMVVVERGEVIGIVSSGELEAAIDPERPVRERIAGRPVIATPRMPVKDAANLLRGRKRFAEAELNRQARQDARFELLEFGFSGVL